MVVLGVKYLKPLTDLARAIYPVVVERRLAMAIEEGIHFVATGDAFEHFTVCWTDCGVNDHLE